MIASFRDHIQNYFHQFESQLVYNYPGLKLSKFIFEFELFSKAKIDELAFSQKTLNQFFSLCDQGVPFAHINHQSYFFKNEFYINNNVLIPRSESEILVEKTCKIIHENNYKSLIDLGTGSGCLLLSTLNECPEIQIATGVDISSDALLVAKKNAYFLQNQRKLKSIKWINKSYFSLENIGEFDVLISNPPYIEKSDLGVHHQADKYEPHSALYIELSSYEYFKNFFDVVHALLRPGGYFMIEGHENHLQELLNLSSLLPFNEVELISDYTQRLRFIRGYKNG